MLSGEDQYQLQLARDQNKKNRKAKLDEQLHHRLKEERRIRNQGIIAQRMLLKHNSTAWVHTSLRGVALHQEMRAQQALDERLQYANVVTLLARRERLRRLYQMDLAVFEKELANQGLAIHKDYI